MLRQFLCFPSDPRLIPHHAVRLTRFQVLIETADGTVLFVAIASRQLPTPDLVEAVAMTLAPFASDSATWRRGANLVADRHHVVVELLDAAFLDVASWNINGIVGYALPVLVAGRAADVLSTMRQELLDSLGDEMSKALARFAAALDGDALSLCNSTAVRVLQYNYLVPVDPVLRRNRRQAASAIALISDSDLWDDDLAGVFTRARDAIDAGRSFWDVLVEGLRASPSSLRCMARCPAHIVATHWRKRLGRLACILDEMPPEFRPQSDAEWHAMAEAVRIIESATRFSIGLPLNRLWLVRAARCKYVVNLPKGLHATALVNGLNDMRDAIKNVVLIRMLQTHDALTANPTLEHEILSVTQRALLRLRFDRVLDLVRRWQDASRRHHAELRAAAGVLDGSAWLSPLAEFTTKDRMVLPILTLDELELEAKAMRHCVETYAESCRMGRVQVWSIRDHGRQRLTTLATMFNRDVSGRLEVLITQHQSQSNRPPDALSEDAALALVAELGRRAEGFTEFWRWQHAMVAMKARKRSREFVTTRLEKPLNESLPSSMSLDVIEKNVRHRTTSLLA